MLCRPTPFFLLYFEFFSKMCLLDQYLINLPRMYTPSFLSLYRIWFVWWKPLRCHWSDCLGSVGHMLLVSLSVYRTISIGCMKKTLMITHKIYRRLCWIVEGKNLVLHYCLACLLSVFKSKVNLITRMSHCALGMLTSISSKHQLQKPVNVRKHSICENWKFLNVLQNHDLLSSLLRKFTCIW